MKILQNIQHKRRIRKAVPYIEERINIHFGFNKQTITITGNETNEYLTEQIIKAIDFGFKKEEALLLKDERFLLEFINIKEHTKRKKLYDVRARIIGTKGKAKKTIEELTGAEIIINNNTVGVIVDNKHLEATIQAIQAIIRGAKHGNAFSYLEKQNKEQQKYDEEDLGLKEEA
jgi:ribosomal RNA assembly protein